MKRFCLILALAPLAHAFCLPALQADEPPLHLAKAKELVQDLNGSSLNVYGGGRRNIDWDSRPCRARTVCSSFVTLLLERTYAWQDDYVKRWLGYEDPLASDYHDAIVAHNGFKQIVHVGKLKPGDILAIRYTDHHVSRNGVEDTGHVMVVDEILDVSQPAEPPVEGATQYTIKVIDSSASGHGVSDTRHVGKGQFTGGIGRGIMRIYADAEDHIAGYTWSDEKKSEFFRAPARDLVAGRLDPDRLPKP